MGLVRTTLGILYQQGELSLADVLAIAALVGLFWFAITWTPADAPTVAPPAVVAAQP